MLFPMRSVSEHPQSEFTEQPVQTGHGKHEKQDEHKNGDAPTQPFLNGWRDCFPEFGYNTGDEPAYPCKHDARVPFHPMLTMIISLTNDITVLKPDGKEP